MRAPAAPLFIGMILYYTQRSIRLLCYI